MLDKLVFIILGIILATLLGQVVCYLAIFNSDLSQAFDSFTSAVNISGLSAWMHGSGISLINVLSASFKNIALALFAPVALVAVAGHFLRISAVIFYVIATAIAYLMIAASIEPSLLRGGGNFVTTLASITALGAVCGLFYWGIFGRHAATE